MQGKVNFLYWSLLLQQTTRYCKKIQEETVSIIISSCNRWAEENLLWHQGKQVASAEEKETSWAEKRPLWQQGWEILVKKFKTLDSAGSTAQMHLSSGSCLSNNPPEKQIHWWWLRAQRHRQHPDIWSDSCFSNSPPEKMHLKKIQNCTSLKTPHTF